MQMRSGEYAYWAHFIYTLEEFEGVGAVHVM